MAGIHAAWKTVWLYVWKPYNWFGKRLLLILKKKEKDIRRMQAKKSRKRGPRPIIFWGSCATLFARGRGSIELVCSDRVAVGTERGFVTFTS